jgi:hypothetical protein
MGFGKIGIKVDDFTSFFQRNGPPMSVMVLTSVVFAASIPSIIDKFIKAPSTKKEEYYPLKADTTKKEEINLSKVEVLTIDASVIVGVLIFLTLSEGFEIYEQTQITIVTANIIFPFAISAVLAVRNSDKFAIRLMVAGFINLMISVILIAIMRM